MSEDRLVEFMFDGDRYTLKYRDSDHSYRVQRETGPWTRYVGISTLAKVAYSDPGGLMGYARNETLAGRDYKETTKFTQECGQAAHDQLEAFATTGRALDATEQPERVRGALTAVAQWMHDYSPKFVASEVIVCSPTYRFAGRFDFLAWVDGELVLGDLKTTEKNWEHFRRYKAVAAYAQLAGYAYAHAEMFPESEQPTKRAILHVSTSGEYDWKLDFAPELSTKSFMSKLQTYRDDAAWNRAEKQAVA